MHAVHRAALLAVALVVGTMMSKEGFAARKIGIQQSVHLDGADSTLSAICPKGSMPDRDTCIAIPSPEDLLSGSPLIALENAHREKSGAWRSYEQIPRRPDRPDDYELYRYPVANQGRRLLMSGYDLDQPDHLQRRGTGLSAVGHGGVDLAAPRGTPVTCITLEHQVGDTEVLFAGKLFGTTILTGHSLREGGRSRDYVVIHGHLDSIATGVRAGQTCRDGDPLGAVGDTGSEGIVHLHLEVRQVRDGMSAQASVAQVLALQSYSIPCDPRNVLPLR